MRKPILVNGMVKLFDLGHRSDQRFRKVKAQTKKAYLRRKKTNMTEHFHFTKAIPR
jgi:hypothetical protein